MITLEKKKHKLNKQVSVNCQLCGKSYDVKPSRLPRTKYCSLHCRAIVKRKPDRFCSIADCEQSHYGMGYCQKHYTRYKVTGDPLAKKKAGSPPKHGMSTTKEYRAHQNMISRCYNQNNKKYYLYGGRGITVCDRWLNSFENFYKDMGASKPGLSLDRINNNGNYEPSNCRWATDIQQNNNRRRKA